MDSIDLGRALKAPFQDTEWVKKTLMGWLWMLLGVTAPAVYGAQLEYIKSVSEGREDLPTWDDFGGKWVKGFMLLVAGFIYTLPIWILFFILALPGIIASVASGGNSGAGLFGGGMCLFSVIAMVYAIGIAVILYGATVNYALKGSFGSLFAFSEIMAHVRDGSGYFNAWLWAIVVSMGASVVMSVLGATGIGYIAVPAVSYLMTMITAHLFGQWAARSYGVAAAAPAYAAPAGYAPPAPPAPPVATAPPVAPPAPPAPPVAPPAPPVAPPAPPAAAPEVDSGFSAPAPVEPPSDPEAPVS
jgi:hypothetical protein